MRNVPKRLAGLLAFLIILGLTAAAGCAEGNESGHLINGSFEWEKTDEKGKKVDISFNGDYKAIKQKDIEAWQTTATDEFIEVFKANNNAYLRDPYIRLEPKNGSIAAELNANEESTLYQVVETEPLSLYEWGLYHGSRSPGDTMALIIGPKQKNDPQKPTIDGRDQFMQMVDWLKTNDSRFSSFTNGIANGGSAITLYSAKFGENGTFLDLSQGQSPFSKTRDDTYSEAWSIWVMTDARATSGTEPNPWTGYGKNNSGFYTTWSESDRAKYRYVVPSGQTKTYFAFVSVESNYDYEKYGGVKNTFGNFLDGCSFDLYRVFTGNTTPHGSALVSGEAGGKAYSMSIDGKHVQYVANGATLTIQAKIPSNYTTSVSFAGVYLTTKDGTRFIKNDYVDDGKTHKWGRTITEDGAYVYTYAPEEETILVESAVGMHFVFIKSPDITYDANGGRLQEGDVSLYSFKPKVTKDAQGNDVMEYIAPYIAHDAVGPAESFLDDEKSSWKFLGWKLTDDDGAYDISGDNSPLLKGAHTVICNYIDTGNSISQQPFVILEGAHEYADDQYSFSETGITWPVPADSKKLYEKSASGLTMIAQWKWRQAFAPMTRMETTTETGTSYDYQLSDVGGSVSIKTPDSSNSDNDKVDAVSSATISRWYFGAEGDTIEATATAEDGYAFEGWYDADDQLIGKNPKITVTVRQGEAKSYYARFSLNYQQTFTRKVKNGDSWTEMKASDPALSSDGQPATYGTTVSSSVAADTDTYRFIGWFKSDGSPVESTMLRNNGRTIMYPVTGEAAYFAGFEPRQSNTWMLHYDANAADASGSTPSQEVEAGQKATIQGNYFTRENYTFQSWNTSADGKGTSYQPGSEYDNTAGAESVTLYAQWKENSKATLTYDANKGTGSMNAQTWYVGKNVTVQENGFQRDGHTFMGWNTKANGSGDLYHPNQSYEMQSQGNVLYAQWAKNVSVTYHPNEGEGTAQTESGYAGEQFSVKTAEDLRFIRENHTFVGWNTKDDGTGQAYEAGATLMPQENLRLYAQWAPNVKVTYHPNEGKGNVQTENGHQGKAFTVKTAEALGFSRDHHAFTGWNTAVNGTGDAYTAGDLKTMPGTDLVLYAQWRENEKVWLRYDANGGSGSMPGRQAHSGEQVCLDQNAFTFVNCRFTGWNTQPDGTGTAYAEGDWLALPGEDITVYAQWEVVRIDLPQTGDSSHPALWLALLSASSAVLACLLPRRAKARRPRA